GLPRPSRAPTKAGGLFLLLLALFPRAFRDGFGNEMCEVFAAQLAAARTRGGRGAVVRLWARTMTGMASAAWRERSAVLRERSAIWRERSAIWRERSGAPARSPRRGPILQLRDLRHAVRR